MSAVQNSIENKFLILLDANGLIFARCDRKPAKEKRMGGYLIRRNQFIVFRAGVSEFLKDLMEVYDVAIFSSTSYENLDAFLQYLPSDIHKRIKFIACRENVKLDPDFGIRPKVKSYDTVKFLPDIWAHPRFNSKRKWNSSNTLLVDHEFSKVRFNHPSNILVIPEWNPLFSEQRIMSLNDIRDGIDRKVEELHECYSQSKNS